MKKVYAFTSDGMEEVEALMVIDLLRRTHKLDVVTVSVKEDKLIKTSHGIKMYTDAVISEIDFDEGDCIFLPGGLEGTNNLYNSEPLKKAILEYDKQGKWLCAICAAPSILGRLGVLKDVKATSYPGFEEQVNCREYGGTVIRDGHFITGKGLGVALEMGLEMIRALVNDESAREVASAIQYQGEIL